MSAIQAVWRKSSYSGNDDVGSCVEVACLIDAFGVRDSKDPRRGHLTLHPVAWADLLTSIRNH